MLSLSRICNFSLSTAPDWYPDIISDIYKVLSPIAVVLFNSPLDILLPYCTIKGFSLVLLYLNIGNVWAIALNILSNENTPTPLLPAVACINFMVW